LSTCAQGVLLILSNQVLGDQFTLKTAYGIGINKDRLCIVLRFKASAWVHRPRRSTWPHHLPLAVLKRPHTGRRPVGGTFTTNPAINDKALGVTDLMCQRLSNGEVCVEARQIFLSASSNAFSCTPPAWLLSSVISMVIDESRAFCIRISFSSSSS